MKMMRMRKNTRRQRRAVITMYLWPCLIIICILSAASGSGADRCPQACLMMAYSARTLP